MKDIIRHSDDEVEIRRGLEPSSHRTNNPREPELLRQSTHSLLRRGKQDVGYIGCGFDESDDRVELLGNSYESYLKNADN